MRRAREAGWVRLATQEEAWGEASAEATVVDWGADSEVEADVEGAGEMADVLVEVGNVEREGQEGTGVRSKEQTR